MQRDTGRICKSAFLVLSLFLSSVAVWAQPRTNATLRVLVREVEPFAFTAGGRQTGFALDLWEAIATQAGFQYELQTVPSAQAMVQALAAKQADIGLGALSITAEREQVIDFSYPFYNSGLDIITNTEGTSLLNLLKTLFHARLL